MSNMTKNTVRLGEAVSREEIERISGVDTNKCMKCGKCSASCPVAGEMEIKPHQFVSYVNRGDIKALQESNSLWKCLSCFACIQRCPRDVKPGKLIEAVRLSVIREREQNYLSPDEIPELLNPELPQQLLVSAFRKYSK
ncbi:MAG: 4Fe-4S dicluster domain-containing protein [Lachnospiraceae bacterium]|nr:4Fe-4S dicluster domain-containing protein [Lachnospiraceae bacterium]